MDGDVVDAPLSGKRRSVRGPARRPGPRPPNVRDVARTRRPRTDAPRPSRAGRTTLCACGSNGCSRERGDAQPRRGTRRIARKRTARAPPGGVRDHPRRDTAPLLERRRRRTPPRRERHARPANGIVHADHLRAPARRRTGDTLGNAAQRAPPRGAARRVRRHAVPRSAPDVAPAVRHAGARTARSTCGIRQLAIRSTSTECDVFQEASLSTRPSPSLPTSSAA